MGRRPALPGQISQSWGFGSDELAPGGRRPAATRATQRQVCTFRSTWMRMASWRQYSWSYSTTRPSPARLVRTTRRPGVPGVPATTVATIDEPSPDDRSHRRHVHGVNVGIDGCCADACIGHGIQTETAFRLKQLSAIVNPSLPDNRVGSELRWCWMCRQARKVTPAFLNCN